MTVQAQGGEAELLTLAGAVEALSEHPLAAAVVRAASTRGLVVPEARGVQATSGLVSRVRWRACAWLWARRAS